MGRSLRCGGDGDENGEMNVHSVPTAIWGAVPGDLGLSEER
jgi:hypothetical protein